MKILMVNKFLHPNGGSETYIFELAKQLEYMGHEIQFFGMEHEKRCMGNRIDCYTDNMDFHTGKLQKILYPFKIIYSFEARKKMLLVLEDFKPDVVHLNNINFQLTPSVIDAVRIFDKKNKKRIKIVATAHDYQWVCPNHMLMVPSDKRLCFECSGGKYYQCSKNKCIHNSMVKSILGSIEAYFYSIKNVYKEVDKIICPSEFLNRKLCSNKVLKEKTVTMHNFIVHGSIVNEMAEQKKKKYPDKYVIYFGRYAEEKGIKTLLEVCKMLPKIDFVFAGNGPLENEVNQVANIINVGFQTGSELQELVKNAWISVFPSEWYENCPFSVVEAQMYGTPVIASNLGGTPELVENEVTGELFDGMNKKQLKEKIEKLWNDSSLRGKYEKGCSNKKFVTVEQYCDKLLEIYME
mgnify:CR=1 FL=1